MQLQRIAGAFLLVAGLVTAPAVWAHAEHGSGEPVPRVAAATRLPKGVDLVVVKTTAHQFSLSSDGQQSIEVLSDDGQAFIHIQQQRVLANINSPHWYRALQPGGGPVPARLKSGEQFLKLEPDWKPVAQQSGFGWYDSRLVDETQSSFKLTLRINGKLHPVSIERKAAAFTGYWSSRLTREPELGGLTAVIPGLTTGAIALTRDPSYKGTLEVLDAVGKPFLRANADGYWVDVTHSWFGGLGLFVNRQNPQSRKEWSADWVKVSDSRMLTYQDPRLKSPEGKSRAVRQWNIPVREMQTGEPVQFEGQMQWHSTGAHKP